MTAVEWLEKRFYFTKGQLIDIDFEQAKEMEKEQIVNSHYQGYRSDIGDTEVSEQYYKETFKSE